MKNWKNFLSAEQEKNYFKELVGFLEQRRSTGSEIYPPEEKVFAAFNLCPLEKVKVVILGQDPYHGAGQAMGLCFSVPKDIAIPPSLRNIKKELTNDLQLETQSKSGDLSNWATQGVFLLNTLLTVEADKPLSHAKKGWEEFTDKTIKYISDEVEHVVFLLWGNPAKSKLELIDTTKHLALTAMHPSPLSASRGFFGCQHFSKTNEQLKKWGLSEIQWEI